MNLKSSQKEDFLYILRYSYSMKKILFSIASLLILVGIGSYFLFFSEKSNWKINYNVTPVESQNPYEAMKARVEEENNKNIELYNTAIRDQDIHLCDGIWDNKKKSDCTDTITMTIAKKEWNPEKCDTLSNTGTVILCKDIFIADRAILAKESKLCKSISDTERKLSCQEEADNLMLKNNITNHTVTPMICARITQKYKETCLSEIREIDETELYKKAIDTDALELCNKITNSELQITCSDTINLKKAISTQNSMLCEAVQNTEKKLYCIGQVSKTDDIELYKSALIKNDLEICSRITSENLNTKCHDTVIITIVKSKKDINLCDSLKNTGMLTACQQLGQ